MINSYLVIKKNNVLLHYKNEFDIQPIKVITPSFPLWRGQGEVKKRKPIKAITTHSPFGGGRGRSKEKPTKIIATLFPLWRGQGEVKKKPNKSYNSLIPPLEGAGGGQKRNQQCQTLYLITLNSESLLDIYAITVLYLKYFYGKRSKIKL